MSSYQHHLRKFLKNFLRSLGTSLGLRGGLTRPPVILGFPRYVILVTYGMRYITMEADCQAYILAKERTSVPMCITLGKTHQNMSSKSIQLRCCVSYSIQKKTNQVKKVDHHLWLNLKYLQS